MHRLRHSVNHANVTNPSPHESRVTWLDGMRGMAAAQVVLLHYASAFLPSMAFVTALPHYRWELIVATTPLFFVLNGYAAVYLFFLLSGAALTYSFSRQPFSVVQLVLRRVIRLGLPMVAAILFGAILIWAWPTAHVEAADVTGSAAWLGAVSPRSPTTAMAVHQILLEGMVAGFRDTTLLPDWVAQRLGLDTLANAFDAPLWTLHIEFIGSLLVLGLVAVRALVPRWVHFAGSAALGAALSTSPLLMFVIGHLAAPALVRDIASRWWRLAGVVLLLGGIFLCSGQQFDLVGKLFLHLHSPVGPTTDLFHFKAMLAEIFVFAGVAMLPGLQRLLALPAARRAGKLSFSLYLVHFPVLFTLVSALFLRLHTIMAYGAVVVLCTLIGGAVSVALAVLFEAWIDGPAILLSRAIFVRPKAVGKPHFAPPG